MIEAMGIVLDDQKQIPTTKAHERVQQLFLGDDNTSVGTLFTNAQNDVSLCGTQYTNSPIPPSTNTIRSQGTTLTIEEVDTKLNTLTSDMQKLHQLIYSLLENRFDINNQSNNNNHTSKAAEDQMSDNRNIQNNIQKNESLTNHTEVAGDPMEATCETP
jgi:hypothetical protein